jgi:hypothetical protein
MAGASTVHFVRATGIDAAHPASAAEFDRVTRVDLFTLRARRRHGSLSRNDGIFRLILSETTRQIGTFLMLIATAIRKALN